jgi:hypothetical protein
MKTFISSSAEGPDEDIHFNSAEGPDENIHFNQQRDLMKTLISISRGT